MFVHPHARVWRLLFIKLFVVHVCISRGFCDKRPFCIHRYCFRNFTDSEPFFLQQNSHCTVMSCQRSPPLTAKLGIQSRRAYVSGIAGISNDPTVGGRTRLNGVNVPAVFGLI